MAQRGVNKDECWEWWGYVRPNGYGRMTVNKKQVYPHRHMYEAFHGPIPDGFDVCHKCDNRKCINPNHLFLGSRLDNMQDAMIKGRLQRGEDRHNSVLTERMVKEARARHENGEMIKDIAKFFGVCKTTMGNAIKKRTWRHVA